MVRRRATRRPLSLVVPPTMQRKFKYAVDYAVTGTVGSQTYYWDLTCMYDPDYTGIGGSTTGLSQWANFYSWYKVKGVKIKAYIENYNPDDSTAAITDFWWGWPGDAMSYYNLDEQADSVAIVTPTGPTGHRTFKKYLRVKPIMTQHGQVNTLNNTYDTCGTLSGSLKPVNKLMLGVHHDNFLGGGLLATQRVTVRFQLTFYATLFGRIPLTQS